MFKDTDYESVYCCSSDASVTVLCATGANVGNAISCACCCVKGGL